MDRPIAILPHTEILRPRKRRAKMVMMFAAISSNPLTIVFGDESQPTNHYGEDVMTNLTMMLKCRLPGMRLPELRVRP